MRVPLSVLLPALSLTGCVRTWSSCDDFEGGTFDTERTWGLDEAELQAALDDEGELSEEACHDLCRAHHWYPDVIVAFRSCEVDGEKPLPDTADTGATHALTCAWTEEAVCEGRAHAAVHGHPEGRGPTPLAAWLARAAHAEAASVKAFVALGKELAAHGAPDELVRACGRAAVEEVRHARRMGALAAARGGLPGRPRMGETPVRPLLALAIENVVEGCVRETWSAMVAHWQATHAADAELAEVMAGIARDEARHGELAFRIHDWASTRLSPREVAEVEAARDRAVAQLLEGLEGEVDESLVRVAGLPTRGDALRLARVLADVMWSAAAA